MSCLRIASVRARRTPQSQNMAPPNPWIIIIHFGAIQNTGSYQLWHIIIWHGCSGIPDHKLEVSTIPTIPLCWRYPNILYSLVSAQTSATCRQKRRHWKNHWKRQRLRRWTPQTVNRSPSVASCSNTLDDYRMIYKEHMESIRVWEHFLCRRRLRR